MTKEQRSILQMLDDIMKPKKEHIDKLQKMTKEDAGLVVARDFLAFYQAEYSKYVELKMAMFEEFTK
jgi:hypothetical protein